VRCPENVARLPIVFEEAGRDPGSIDNFERITITKAGASVQVADFPMEFQLEKSPDGWRISSFGGL
jgi:hypothetical protein